MPSAYQVKILTPYGVQLAAVDDFIKLQMTRKINDVGAFSMTLPQKYNDLANADNMIEIWRKAERGTWKLWGDTRFFLQNKKLYSGSNSEKLLDISGQDAIGLLARRGVSYYSGSAQSEKVAVAADNLLKDIVDENFGASATDTARSIATYLTIQPDFTLAPVLSKDFAWRNVLEVLREIAQTSTGAGTYLAFDVVATENSMFEFRTYTGQRGIDKRFSGTNQQVVILSEDNGSLGSAALEENYLDEKTFVYALGQGEGAARAYSSSSDAARIGISPFGRIEIMRDSRSTGDTTSLTGEAFAALKEYKFKRIFSGKFLDTLAYRYGVEVEWGDRVTAQYANQTFDVLLDIVSITMQAGKETIEMAVRNE